MGNAPSGDPRRRFTDPISQCSSRIGPSVSLTGDFRGGGDLEIEGRVQGTLELEGLLWLRPGGHIEGDVTAADIVIEGEVHGNIHARHKLELRASCRVLGDLTAEGLAIADGGHFEGTITMAGRTRDRTAVSFTEKRSPAD